MLNLAYIYNSQSKYGVVKQNKGNADDIITYQDYLSRCRRYLTDRTTMEYYSFSKEDKENFSKGAINDFVNENPLAVEGFIVNDTIDTDLLLQTLARDIIDFGILREALEDPRIQEIQINDWATVWVVRQGRTELFTKPTGEPFQFLNNDELRSTIDRLIYNPDSSSSSPRTTKTNPLLNTRTAGDGYRLSAVDDSAITPDINNPNGLRECYSVTIRKYAPSMMKFEDFERNQSLTKEMSDFLRLCGRANIRLACVGPTSSGKTTLLNAIVWEVDPSLRLLLIQNPTEIMIYDRKADKHNSRNVLHWEAQDLPPEKAKDPTTPTMANMIAHTLRNTPDVIVPGEVRTPDEFYQMNRALKTGHRVLTTWHALDGADAVDRAATELSTLGGSASEHARSLANSFDIFVSQQRLGDGSRKVMTIEESTGKFDDDGRLVTNKLFEFILTGEVDKDPNDPTGMRATKIHGYFQQSGVISPKLTQAFYAVGISKEELEPFIHANPVVEGQSNLNSQIVGKHYTQKSVKPEWIE